MSSKATIVYDDDFHLYREPGDRHHVYLQMRGTHHEAGYNRVMVPIPIHIWEVIRKQGGPDLSLAGLTDDQLLDHVADRVDERIAGYQKAVAEDASHLGILAFACGLPFGKADTPREEQIAKGLDYYRDLRRDQQEIKTAIEKLEAKTSLREEDKQP